MASRILYIPAALFLAQLGGTENGPCSPPVSPHPPITGEILWPGVGVGVGDRCRHVEAAAVFGRLMPDILILLSRGFDEA